jgi:hypothetical protein
MGPNLFWESPLTQLPGRTLVLSMNAGRRLVAWLQPAAIFRRAEMHNGLPLSPLLSLIAGILILMSPRLLNYIVAIYLIIIGVLGLSGHRL